MGSLSLFYAMILFSLRLGELPTRGSAVSNLVTIAYDTPVHFALDSQLILPLATKGTFTARGQQTETIRRRSTCEVVTVSAVRRPLLGRCDAPGSGRIPSVELETVRGVPPLSKRSSTNHEEDQKRWKP